jgi:hypothetical protein
MDIVSARTGAAGVAVLTDLGQVPGDRGLLGEPLPDQVAVRIDQAGAVARRTQQVLDAFGTGVALDRVQRPAQTAGAFQQPGVRGEQVVHGGEPLPRAHGQC